MVRRIWNNKYTIAASVSLLTLIVYLPALMNEFVNWDDGPYVFANYNIRSFDASFFRYAFLEFHVSNWHPLTWISHAADYAIWGLNPLGHHLTSILLHAINTSLVIVLVLKLLEVARGGTSQNAPSPFLNDRAIPITAGVTGLLFGIHPVHLGIIFLANMELGYLTPPVGLNLFLSSSRFGVPLWTVVVKTFPFLLALAVVVLLVTYVPWFTLGALAR